ncbi:hypothetical protein EDF62_0169 [Leucobacter luti]|uniref:Uncharacterized protein n=1 Tax=Leucobacter luti TaxID=340320 RepID=A0A4R6S6R1_9MICO|nr:hypothetical protein EDF62_0169 [Leucobacter luti]
MRPAVVAGVGVAEAAFSAVTHASLARLPCVEPPNLSNGIEDPWWVVYETSRVCGVSGRSCGTRLVSTVNHTRPLASGTTEAELEVWSELAARCSGAEDPLRLPGVSPDCAVVLLRIVSSW